MQKKESVITQINVRKRIADDMRAKILHGAASRLACSKWTFRKLVLAIYILHHCTDDRATSSRLKAHFVHIATYIKTRCRQTETRIIADIKSCLASILWESLIYRPVVTVCNMWGQLYCWHYQFATQIDVKIWSCCWWWVGATSFGIICGLYSKLLRACQITYIQLGRCVICC